jgi:hypothetical protein
MHDSVLEWVAIGAACAGVVGLLVLAAFEDTPPPDRPRRYRGRHIRRPWWRRIGRRSTGHEGVTLDSPPLATVLAAVNRTFTPTELLPAVVVRPAVAVPEPAALAADTHHAFDPIDDAIIMFRIGMARLEADWARRPDPRCVNRTAAWERGEQETGQWDAADLKAAFADAGLAGSR